MEQLPTDLRKPRQTQSPALWSITHGSSSSSLSPLASSLTRSVFHSEVKTWLFSKSFSPWTFSFLTGLITRTLGPSKWFYSAQRLDLFAYCVRLSRLLIVVFERTLNHCTFIHSLFLLIYVRQMNGVSEFSQCMAHNDGTVMVLVVVVEHYCPLIA